MAEVAGEKQIQSTTEQHTGDHVETIEHVKDINAAIARTDSYLDEQHVPLGWRSWLVVLITLFGFGIPIS
jgi:pyridoxal biosynthesis lyase PdxS